ncbi:MAG: hypothetical protein ABI083_06400 [Lapillicoccus sp.]
MVKLYLIIILVIVALLALPSTRRMLANPRAMFTRDNARTQGQRAGETARSAAGTARDAASSAGTVARGTANVVRGAGESIVAGHAARLLRTLARTLVIEASPATVAPLLTDAMVAVAVVDPVAAVGAETQAWVYSGLGEVRLVAVPLTTPRGEASTVFGVASFEYALGEPQGVSAAGQSLDRVTQTLDEHGIRWSVLERTFTPGPDITSEGLRTADPLS